MSEETDSEKLARYTTSALNLLEDPQLMRRLQTEDPLIYSWLESFSQRIKQERNRGQEIINDVEQTKKIESFKSETNIIKKKQLALEILVQLLG